MNFKKLLMTMGALIALLGIHAPSYAQSSPVIIDSFVGAAGGTNYSFTLYYSSPSAMKNTPSAAAIVNSPWYGNNASAVTWANYAYIDAATNSTIPGGWHFDNGAYGSYRVGAYTVTSLSSLSSLPSPTIGNLNLNCFAGTGCASSYAYSSNTILSGPDYFLTAAPVPSGGGGFAPEIDGSLIPQVSLLLGCLFLMFGRKKQNVQYLTVT